MSPSTYPDDGATYLRMLTNTIAEDPEHLLSLNMLGSLEPLRRPTATRPHSNSDASSPLSPQRSNLGINLLINSSRANSTPSTPILGIIPTPSISLTSPIGVRAAQAITQFWSDQVLRTGLAYTCARRCQTLAHYPDLW